MTKYICPVCYYPEIEEYPNDGMSYEICTCCSTEFGNDDSIYSHKKLREQWIANGKKFWAAEHEKMSADDIKIHEILQNDLINIFLDIERVSIINHHTLGRNEITECMILSEEALAKDWLTSEEDEAWKDL